MPSVLFGAVVNFVHVMPERLAARVRAAGLAARSTGRSGGRGVYLMPTLPSYTLTHQWVRELSRWHPGPYTAADVRLADDEQVWAGRYSEVPLLVTAAEAMGMARDGRDVRGFEVFVPRRIAAGEIRRIRKITKPVGWRYLPDAHGRRPCGCVACLRPGTYGAATLRRRFSPDPPLPTTPELVARLRAAASPDDIIDSLWGLASRRPGVTEELEPFLEHPDDDVRDTAVEALQFFRGRDARRLRHRFPPPDDDDASPPD